MKKHLGLTRLLFVIAIITIIFSCKKDKSVGPLIGPQYFPLKVGSYIVYDVDSINFYDVTLTSDTTYWQIKELVDSNYIDNTGTPASILYRYKRANSLSPWNLYRIWSAKVTSTQAQKVEENLRFIKLTFPIFPNGTWKGNAYIQDSTGIYTNSWVYNYENIDTAYIANNTVLDSSLTVYQEYNVNAVQKDIEIEGYTKNIGLTYKQSMHVTRQNFSQLYPWIPTLGTIVTYTYNSKG